VPTLTTTNTQYLSVWNGEKYATKGILSPQMHARTN